MKKHQNIIFTALAVVIMIGAGIWYYFHWLGNNYFTTENAKVSSDLRTVIPASSSRLVKLNVTENSMVKENEVLGRLQNGSYLRSPINGQVVKSNVVLNQTVSPSSAAFVIADTNNIYIGANIEETDIRKIKEGQEVTVKLDAYPGKKYKAHVKEVENVTQTTISGNATSYSTSGTYTKVTQLIPVKIVIDDDVDLNGLIGTNSTIDIKIR